MITSSRSLTDFLRISGQFEFAEVFDPDRLGVKIVTVPPKRVSRGS